MQYQTNERQKGGGENTVFQLLRWLKQEAWGRDEVQIN